MMKVPDVRFPASDAVRRNIPLLFGVFGTPGSGKTPSAIRIASGMAEVYGGVPHVVDTEAGRAKMYAERYRFKHAPFPPPHGPLYYLAAIRDQIAQGARVIVVDNFSHEHGGIGGLLDRHAEEVTRLTEKWRTSEEKVTRSAWVAPKAERKFLLNEIEQLAKDSLQVAFVFTFRADQKSDQTRDGKFIDLGFMPETDPKHRMLYMLTASALLLPRSMGHPTWKSDKPGESMMIRLPDEFSKIFADGRQLDERHGREMAEWAKGSMPRPQASSAVVDTPPAGKSGLGEVPDSGQPELTIEARIDLLKDCLNNDAKTVAAAEKLWNHSRSKSLRTELLKHPNGSALMEDLTLFYEARVGVLEELAQQKKETQE